MCACLVKEAHSELWVWNGVIGCSEDSSKIQDANTACKKFGLKTKRLQSERVEGEIKSVQKKTK